MILNSTILIIYPHWHPANLAGVHRPRLTGNYLHEFGWNVRVLTVEEAFFEERLDPDFHKTFSDNFVVTRVKARKVGKPRIIGDIGLRAFMPLRRKALEILRTEKIDFIWIPIPSFYMALLGPFLYKNTGVPYGIDYIDPWVRDLTNQKNVRAVLSQWLARILEPLAVKKVALITGVNRKYYEAVLKRNGLLYRKPYPVIDTDFPYGFDPNDHNIAQPGVETPWKNQTSGSKQHIWLYTGAFLPNSHLFIDLFFKTIATINSTDPEKLAGHQFWFIGTGPYPAKRITAYARDHGISKQVFEIRERFPYLNTLNFQAAASTIMIIGSTEKHYTASKTYQSLLSKRPVFAIMHKESQASTVLQNCKADQFTVRFTEDMAAEKLSESIKQIIKKRLDSDDWNPDLSALDQYSSKESARKLAEAMEKVIAMRKT